MLSYIIRGEKSLKGSVKISGSKNATLPILATAILNPNEIKFYNVPNIEDIKVTIKILRYLGCKVIQKNNCVIINSKNINKTEIPVDMMCKCRSTVILVGAMLARFKKVTFSNPGGCNIGKRPIDMHIKAFERMGVKINRDGDRIICNANKIKASKINLDFPSVGATENCILASVFSAGITHICNSAKEPEIVDLIRCLNKMGAKIYGAGTSTITIFGVKKLHRIEYTIMPDRIETGTFLCAAIITKSSIEIDSTNPQDLFDMLIKIKEMGCKVWIKPRTIFIKPPKNIKPVNICTKPYPGFPTDMQPIIGSVLTKANGNSKIKENIFERRFDYCNELKKMKANIVVNKNTATIKGNSNITGTRVRCTDLRAGAALVIAGLGAKGTTVVTNIEHILRGYENLDKKFASLGANIIIKR